MDAPDLDRHGCGNVPEAPDAGEAGDNAGLLLRGIEKTRSVVGWCFANQARSLRIPNSRVKYMY